MPKRHNIAVNGLSFSANSGSVLLDAALRQGIKYPHDCRAGRCGTCLTQVRAGITVGGDCGQPGYVHACQARVLSDLQIAFDAVPEPVTIDATLSGLNDLAADVVELEVSPAKPFEMLPGQYCRFTFRGFPPRSFSPTVPLVGRNRPGTFRLQIKRVRDGRVSTQLGKSIGVGHGLTIDGPFGAAYHRPGCEERLVMAASGTGFAPILAVADAALKENPQRQMVLIAGARRLQSLYMPAALGRLSALPNVTVIAAAEEPQTESRLVRPGRIEDHLPSLGPADIVFVAGGPDVVGAVSGRARSAGAQVFSDAFEPAEAAGSSIGGLWAKVTGATSWMQ